MLKFLNQHSIDFLEHIKKIIIEKFVQLSLDLLKNYPIGYNVRPVLNHRYPVNVSLQMNLYHIIDMDEKLQTLTTNSEIIMEWEDAFLRWDPE